MRRTILVLLALCAGALTAAVSATATTTASLTPSFAATNIASCSGESTVTLTLDAVDPPTAKRPLDVVHVVDESGSITSESFATLKSGIRSWAVGQVFGPTAVQAGLVAFASVGRQVVILTPTQTTFLNAVAGFQQLGGYTNIGAGIETAQQQFVNYGRPAAQRVMIVSTDGENNRQEAALPAKVAAAKAAGILIFTIGVGPAVNAAELTWIASSIPGVTTTLLVPDYAALGPALEQISSILNPAATAVNYAATPAAGWEIAGASASGGTVTSSASSLTWTAPELRTGRTTITYMLRHTGTTGGTLAPQATADLTWTDDAGTAQSVSYASQTVAVSGCNAPPQADAGADRTVELAASRTAAVVLDGTASTDDGQVSPLTYSWSEGSTVLGTGATLTASLGLGVHDVVLTVNDGEHTSTDTVTITIVDPTPPTVTPVLAGSLSPSGWYTSDVAVSWTVTDLESDVTATSGCEPSTVSADTAAASFSCGATSAGGTTTVATPSIRRDATVPTVTYAGNAGTYTVADTVAITCTAADELSGVASTTCADVTRPAYAFGPGTSSLSASATDVAGNVGTGSTSFTVTVTALDLCTLTKQFVQGSARYQALKPWQKTALDAHTAAACNALERMTARLGARQKAVFVKVYEQAVSVLVKQGWLTPAQATMLVALAKAI